MSTKTWSVRDQLITTLVMFVPPAFVLFTMLIAAAATASLGAIGVAQALATAGATASASTFWGCQRAAPKIVTGYDRFPSPDPPVPSDG